jgi:hypothetical protein
MQRDDHPNWKSDKELILSKLCATYFAVRKLFYFLNIDACWIVHFAYFHSVIKYGTIFGGNSTNTDRVLLLLKRIIRTMMLV